MDIVNTFLPLAADLLDNVFPTPVVYRREDPEQVSYDPATGLVTRTPADYPINAGVLSMGRAEDGGTGETRELRLWIHHGIGGLPFLPLTGDYVIYLGEMWKVTVIDPTYAGAALIASRIALNSMPGSASLLSLPPTPSYVASEDGSYPLAEDGSRILQER